MKTRLLGAAATWGPPTCLSARISRVTPSGNGATGAAYRAKGMKGPWGTAVDGDNTVWVADCFGATLNQFCGRQAQYCPPGKKMGDPITPAGGYTNGALKHLTSVQIDQSGSVWVCNNWSDQSAIKNPVGGDCLVQSIGLAAPVTTPRAGPPIRP